MKIPPKYEITAKSIYYLTQIEASKALFEHTKIPNKVIENLTRQSLLKSSLYSAKIEGNRLVLDEALNLKKLDPNLQERIEVENILTAFSFIQSKKQSIKINLDLILKLHGIIMNKISPKNETGNFRKEPSAIFNQAGIAIYVTPSPSQITTLLKKLVAFINEKSDELTPVKAFLSHLIFEKIHPFIDGNGRVGRLLVQTVLTRANYHFNYLLSFEEILSSRKVEYYDVLERNDPGIFLEFMLEVMYQKVEELKTEVIGKDFTKEDTLLPRRREILSIIRDHMEISLDKLQRRFLKVPARTLRYDLKSLEKEGYIIKIGSTRGALYKIRIQED